MDKFKAPDVHCTCGHCHDEKEEKHHHHHHEDCCEHEHHHDGLHADIHCQLSSIQNKPS